jgi:hypothetical protein
MKHTAFFFIAILCLCLAGCAGMQFMKPGAAPDHRAGLPVFIGVASARYLPNGRDRAVELALRGAARQAAFFHGVEAVIKTTETYDPQLRVTRINETRELVYDTDYEKHLPLLAFDAERDVREEHGALFVRAAFTGATGGNPFAAVPVTRTAAKPSWVEDPPAEYNGFPCATGVSGPRLSYHDAVTASYEDAVFALVKNSLAQVYASGQMTEHAMLDASVTLVRGAVKGFYILETWRDPESGAAWTLAVAREVNRITNE